MTGRRSPETGVAAVVADQAAANRRRATLVVAALPAVAVTLALVLHAALGLGLGAMVVLVAAAGAVTAGAWLESDRVALAAGHARPAEPGNQPRLHNLVEGLCVAAGVPKPRLYVVDDPGLNAFTAGRNPRRSSLAVTTGLLQGLDRIELEAVIAHELGHVKSGDTMLATLATTMVAGVALASELFLRFWEWRSPRHADEDRPRTGPGVAVSGLGWLLVPLAPLAARLMRVTLQRRRETLADVTGVGLTRYPPGLIAALEKLRDGSTVVRCAPRATAHLWIENPTDQPPSPGRLVWLNCLFNTHPPLEERIQALREL